MPVEAKALTSGTPAAKGGSSRKKGSPQTRKSPLQINIPPIHYFPIGAILLLVCFLAFTELTRNVAVTESRSQTAASTASSAHLQEINQLERIVGENPSDTRALLRYANLLQDHSSKDHRFLLRAIEAYNKYLELEPASPDPRVDLGICYFELAKIDTARAFQLVHMAIHEMESVYEVHPTHQAAAFNLGIVNLSGGNAAVASRWFRRARELNPDSDLGQRAGRLLEQHAFQESVQ